MIMTKLSSANSVDLTPLLPVKCSQIGSIRCQLLSQLCQLSSLRQVSMLPQLSFLRAVWQTQGMGFMNGTHNLHRVEKQLWNQLQREVKGYS